MIRAACQHLYVSDLDQSVRFDTEWSGLGLGSRGRRPLGAVAAGDGPRLGLHPGAVGPAGHDHHRGARRHRADRRRRRNPALACVTIED